MVAKARWYLCLDQGGSSSRALVVDAAGRILSRGQCAVDTQRPRPGWVEQSPQDLLQSLRQSAEQALAGLRLDAGEFVSAGLVTQRSSLLCWHRTTAEPLTPVLSWQDTRAADVLAHCVPDSAALLAQTGLWPNAHFGASKLAWCLREIPAVQKAAQRGELCMGPLAAWLAQSLTCSTTPRVDVANAQRTLLMSLASGDWDEALCARFGIDPDWLPTIVDSDHGFGTLTAAGGSLPLRVLGGDQGAALFAHGEPDTDTLYINLGTGAFLMRPLRERPTHTGRQLLSLNWQRAGQRWWTLEGTVNGAGAALDWWSQRYAGQDYLPLIEAALALRKPPYFLNAVGGLGSPDWRADLNPSFASAPENSVTALASVLESVVFLIARNAEHLGPFTQVVVGGGLSRSAALRQRIADVLEVPVAGGEEPEATGKGLSLWLRSSQTRLHAASAPQTPTDTIVLPTAGGRDAYRAWSCWWSDVLSGRAI